MSYDLKGFKIMGRKIRNKGKKIKLTPFSDLIIDKSRKPDITTIGEVGDVNVIHFKNKRGNPAASVISVSDDVEGKQILIADRNTSGIKSVNVEEKFDEETGERTYNLVAKTLSNKVIATTVSIQTDKKKTKVKRK